MTLDRCSVDLVKGYTKASVIAFVVMAVSELDLEDDWEQIVPFMTFLDRAWLVPCHAPWISNIKRAISLKPIGTDFVL